MKFSHALRLVAGLIEALVRLMLFFLGALFILLTAYFLGFAYLLNIYGNDSFNALNTIHWLARWWPKIPYWYTNQGAGVSFIWGYPMLSSLMVVLISFWQKINLTASFRLLGFLSLPLTAVGMALFTWRRLRNQTAALIGAIFYLLMPLSWIWLYEWGFFAEGVACIFIFPVLLFYDRFLEGLAEKKIDWGSRLSLLLAVVFLGLVFATHPAVFFGIIRIMAIYSPVYLLLKSRKLKGLLIGFSAVFLVSALAVLLAFFLIGNYQYYTGIAKASSGPTFLSKEDFILYSSIPIKSFLGLEKLLPGDIKFTVANAVIPVLVWLPAIAGTVLSLFFSVKVFSLALSGWLSLLFLSKLEIPYFLIDKLPFVGYFVGLRTETLILRMILPIISAFGIWAMPGLILKLITFWLRLKNELLNWGLETIKAVISGAVTLGMAGFLIFYFSDYPSSIWQRDEVRYGPGVIQIRNPFSYNLNPPLPPLETKKKIDLWKETAAKLLDKSYWPKPDLKSDFLAVPYTRKSLFPYESLKEFNQEFGNDQFLRLDVSPNSGGVTQTLNTVNKSSMINLYTITLNLLGSFWGHQQQVAFSQNDGRLETANEVAKWFGTRFLIYNRKADEMQKYENSNDWQDWDAKETDLDVIEYKQAPKLWTLTQDKPMILMIGNVKKKTYESVFRAATKGALSYDDFWLIQGGERLDSYSLEELEKFDLLLLFGYRFKNQRRAFSLLDSYLKNGGSVFLSSGWQYTDAIWEAENLPDFFPVESLSWTDDFGPEDAYKFDGSLIGQVNMGSFGPLSWEGKGWGVSVGSRLRPWAKSILAVNGQSLVTGGEYGKGKVVLSGMNLIGHMHSFDYNQSEKDFFRQIFKWLNSSPSQDLSAIVTAKRDFPDKIEFTFNQATEKPAVFYFRESFFPAWQARLIASAIGGQAQLKVKSLPIYRAGPGFKLMMLPQITAGDRLTLEFKPGIRNLLFILVSLITLFTLLVFVILGRKIYQPVLSWFDSWFKKIKSKTKTVKEDWKKEEEY